MVVQRIVFAVEAAADRQLGRRIVVSRPASSSASECRCGNIFVAVVVVVVFATIIFSANTALEKRRVKTRALLVLVRVRAIGCLCVRVRATGKKENICARRDRRWVGYSAGVARWREKCNLHLNGRTKPAAQTIRVVQSSDTVRYCIILTLLL